MKDFKLIEHNLIPVSLFALNMSIVHLIYLLFMNNILSVITFTVLACTSVLIAGIILKNKLLMTIGAIVYIIALAFSF